MKDEIKLTAKQFENLVREVSRHVTENARAIARAGGNVPNLLEVLDSKTAYSIDDSGRLKVTFLDDSGRESMLTASDIVTSIKLQGIFPKCFAETAGTPEPATPTADTPTLSPIERLKKYHAQQAAQQTTKIR
ncbi:MAG: hypothetical protein ABFE01_19675 [Phycisphaerales bacterium]